MAAVGATLAVPGVAQAAQKNVDMGLPTRDQKAFQKTGSDVNDYFPHRVTIHVGDTVRFVPTGFHTVDLPRRGGTETPLVAPNGQTVSGSLDAAGSPFWFNGQPSLSFTPALMRSSFGKRLSYSGRKSVLSGLALSGRPKSMTVRFTRSGTFRYFCNLHPGMTGIVKVVSRRHRVPSAAADRRTVRRQVAAALRVAKKLPTSVKPGANTVDVGLQGKGGVHFYAFVPDKLTVASGTTVTFRMVRHSKEIHTATTAPGTPENDKTYLGALVAGFNQPVFDPRSVYPSDAPGTIANLSPTWHGNGFWNTGAMAAGRFNGLPSSGTVRFTTPGTYDFYCLIHPFMKATVTVQ
jgi:plastocyanin